MDTRYTVTHIIYECMQVMNYCCRKATIIETILNGNVLIFQHITTNIIQLAIRIVKR